VRITGLVAYDGELLVTLEDQAGIPLTGVFRVANADSRLNRVIRLDDEGTPLRA
jgi:hypothetical protein